MDSGNAPIIMYLDLSKAFGTIDHNILLHKLNYYGIENNNLSLFKRYIQIVNNMLSFKINNYPYIYVSTLIFHKAQY